MSRVNFHHTSETRIKISKALKGNQHMLGKQFSIETRTKMAEAHKGKCLPQIQRARISNARKGIIFSKETRIKLSESLRQFFSTSKGIEARAKLTEARKGNKNMLGHIHSKETREKLCVARQQSLARGERYGFAAMSREQLLEIVRKAIAKSCAKPNQAEAKLMELINEACPNQYKYTGDASVQVASLYPDFFNVNGKKKVIEMFGDYWHSKQATQNKDWRATELGRIMAYNSYGFDCLIVWQSELKTKSHQKLVEIIRKFNRMKVKP